MRGEFIGVWSETWREIRLPLIDEPLGESEEGVPEDIFYELYRELAKALEHWPHPAVKQSLLTLYGFASDFPSVRHGTPSTGMKRDIDMRDMVAMSILLAGFTPYLTHGLNPDVVYRGT